jgi:hypothetical protein
MAFLRDPSRTEMESAIINQCSQLRNAINRANEFALQMDRMTDAELEGVGFSATRVAYIRSACVGMKNTYLKYKNQAPMNSDDPSYFVEWALDPVRM